jgi:hypothetical protein
MATRATTTSEPDTDTSMPASEASWTDVPLTERVLGALPGPRIAWIGVWSLLGPLRVGALLAVLAATRAHPSQAIVDSAVATWILGYVTLVALWANPRLCRRIGALESTLRRIAPSQPPEAWSRAISSIRGPLALTALLVACTVPSTLSEFGSTVAAMDVVLLFVVAIPAMTMLWEYGALLRGLDRLGRADLVLDRFPEDRALGLGPVGAVAMSGLWPILIAGVPVLLLAGADLPTLAIGTSVLAVTIGLFVLSMSRLHQQMRVAKDRYVTMTRSLVAEAYAPVLERTDLATLAASSSALGAAQALADRAEKVLEWPIDDRMVTSLTVVVTGVVTSLVVKVVLLAIGV